MTSAPFLSRQFGDYLLVAELSEDALGTVFRALCASDERRFVRLRLLKSEGLSSDPIERLIQRQNAAAIEPLVHEAIAHRPQLDIAEGIPFMTWDETYGWTLDTMLARVRAFGIRIPAEYALLIAERIAAALEHVHRTVLQDQPAHHGLLWPGFISISHDAAIRIGGFGMAEGVLPSLNTARLTAEVAPYLAPEVRNGAETGACADVYSLGAILAELLTGRRPTLDAPSAELRAGDPRSEELGAFLQRCMAPPQERFASAAEAHRALQLMVTGNPFSLYTANLALFLYKLLNPESQSVVAHSDTESTNPIVKGARPPQEPAQVDAFSMTTPRRRSGDFTPEQSASHCVETVFENSAVAPPEPLAVPAEPVVAAAEIAPVELAPIPEEAACSLEEIVAIESGSLWMEEDEAVPGAVAALDAGEPAGVLGEVPPIPELARRHAMDLLEQPASRPVRVLTAAWSRPAAALTAAAGLTVGAFLIISPFHAPELNATTRSEAGSTHGARPAAASASPALGPAPAPAPPTAVVAVAPVALAPSGAPGSFERAVARSTVVARPVKPIKPVKKESRAPAEDLRLRAALARIEADRQNAKEAAGDLFGQGRHSEEEGERLLRERDYDAAQLAFSRAARLFQQAGEIGWEERLRQSDPAAAR